MSWQAVKRTHSHIPKYVYTFIHSCAYTINGQIGKAATQRQRCSSLSTALRAHTFFALFLSYNLIFILFVFDLRCWYCCSCCCVFIILYGAHLKFPLCFIKRRCSGAKLACEQSTTATAKRTTRKKRKTIKMKHITNRKVVWMPLWQTKADNANIYLKQLVSILLLLLLLLL